MNDEVRLLTTSQTAQKLSVCESTIRNLVKRGELQCFRTYSGRLRFNSQEVEKLAERRNRLYDYRENFEEVED